MIAGSVPITIDDPVNVAILRISEDQIQGFSRDPLGDIARASGVELPLVIERIRAMLETGTIRRVRQTLLSTSLAEGALVAWQVPEDRLQDAFDYMFRQDPFSGHVVIRTTDAASPGARYRLWTTVKVPQGYSIRKHCEFLAAQVGAENFRRMRAKRLFRLGVGHTRRRGLAPGARTDDPAEVLDTKLSTLSEREWDALTALKREFEPAELISDLWAARAAEAGMPLAEFYAIAESLQERRLVGRFSTFLEHVKPVAGNQRVTRYNALFHWAVPRGREIEAGQEVGRHHIMTHAYWREGGPEFHEVNVMGVAHGTDKDLVLQHKAAIDEHLAEAGIPIAYTAVFWGGRSEIKPSEIAPAEYRAWCEANALEPDSMLEDGSSVEPEDTFAGSAGPDRAAAADAMKPFIKAVGTGPNSNRHLSRDEARQAMRLILQDDASPAQAAAFFLGARVQGETPDELLGFIDAIQQDAVRIQPAVDHLVDIGTPYDGRRDLLYITIGAALVASAAGAPQFLHGSGPMPPKDGLPLAPVLQALGLPVDLAPAQVQDQIETHGFGYLDARIAAPAVYALRPLREQIGLRTALSTVEKIYDLANAPHHIVGVTHLPYIERFAGTIERMPWKRSLLVQGLEGTEDVGTAHRSRIVVVTPQGREEQWLDPATLGLRTVPTDELSTSLDPAAHGSALRDILAGRDADGAEDVVVLNAALRLWLAGVAADLPAATALARTTLRSGAAADLLHQLQV